MGVRVSTIDDTLNETTEAGYKIQATKHGYSVYDPHGVRIREIREQAIITPTSNLMRGITWANDHAAGRLAPPTPFARYQDLLKQYRQIRTKNWDKETEEDKALLPDLQALWDQLSPEERAAIRSDSTTTRTHGEAH
jgi:hypothetical protein